MIKFVLEKPNPETPPYFYLTDMEGDVNLVVDLPNEKGIVIAFIDGDTGKLRPCQLSYNVIQCLKKFGYSFEEEEISIQT